MLRPKKFRPFETTIMWGIALLLLGAAIVGVVFAIQRAHWRLAMISGGMFILAAIYLRAAKRGWPL